MGKFTAELGKRIKPPARSDSLPGVPPTSMSYMEVKQAVDEQFAAVQQEVPAGYRETSVTLPATAAPLFSEAIVSAVDPRAGWSDEAVRRELAKLSRSEIDAIFEGTPRIVEDTQGVESTVVTGLSVRRPPLYMTSDLLAEFGYTHSDPVKAALHGAKFRGHTVDEKAAARLLKDERRCEKVKRSSRPQRAAARQAAIATCKASANRAAEARDHAKRSKGWHLTFDLIPHARREEDTPVAAPEDAED